MRNIILKITILLLFSAQSHAAILWAGGEEIDFPAGDTSTLTFSAGGMRTGYARGCLYGGNIYKSSPFPGGAVTSLWASARVSWANGGSTVKLFGVGKSGTGHSIWVGISATSFRLSIYKYDGSNFTLLAAEPGASLVTAFHKLDLQIINYGATGTVNVYLNAASTPIVTYTGNLVTGGNTSLDDFQFSGVGGSTTGCLSEFLVADTDTRLMSVVTLAPSAVGTTNQWTGAYTDIDETSVTTNDLISSDTSGQNFQCNLTDLPAGSFSIQGVRVSTSSAKASGVVNGLSAGLYTNSTIDAPAATSLPAVWDNLSTLYQLTNPVTSSPWTTSEMNSLQMNLQATP